MQERFEIIKLIGKSVTGGVYEAICKQTGKNYTIRRFFDEFGDYRSGWEEDFLAEMQQLQQIQHPNILSVIESGMDEDGAYVISEHHISTPLHRHYPEGMPLRLFYQFVKEGLYALIALHEAGIVHGRLGYASFHTKNLKNGEHCYLLKDYGLRTIAPYIQGIDPALTLPTYPVFLTPEHFNDQYIDDQTDLYMFGQLCYYLLIGDHPIKDDDLEEAARMHLEKDYPPPKHFRSAIPSCISGWVEWITNVQPSHRPSDCYEALNHFLNLFDQ